MATATKLAPDRELLTDYFAALFDPAEGVAGRVCLYQKEPYQVEFFDPRDTTGMIDTAVSLAAKHELYCHVNLCGPAAEEAITERHGRPNEEEISAVMGLPADVDAGKQGYPSRAVVDAAIEAMPLAPSLVINTGGLGQGAHAYWLLHEPFAISDEEDRAWIKSIAKRWHNLLRKKLKGGKLDSTFDLVHPFRPAGSISHKHGTLVTPVLFEPNRRYEPADFEQFLEDEGDAPGSESPPSNREPVASGNGYVPDIEEVITRARVADNGAKFERLFDRGDTSGYPSPSEADKGLVHLVAFWCGRHPGLIEEVMRRSKLCREKWDIHKTYLPETITKVLQQQTEFYRWGHAFHLTDSGNAERFAYRHRNDVRHCHPWGKWLAWDGRRWKADDTGAVHRLAKETARSILHDAADEADDEQRKALVKFSRQSESATRRSAMLQLARSELGIPVLPEQLDADPWALNCPNGTLNLRTGELRRHQREDLITKLCPTEYDPSAKAPRWELFVCEIFAGSNRLVDFAQRLAGYCLTGSTADHLLPILHGCGSNGKSTFLNALRDTLGADYSSEGPPDLLMLKRNEQHPTALASLFGKRLVVAMETEENRRLAESLVKQLTGGDTIACRRMREDFWQFQPTHKILLACNHRPRIRGTDWAIWRRIRLVPFNVTIDPAEQDKHLGEKLAAEAPGILAWAVRGCLAWQQNGLGSPPEVEKATADYRSAEDSVAGFLAEVCELDPSAAVRASDLLKEYRNWSGDKHLTQRAFGQMLSERGFERFRSNGVWYKGIALPAEP